MNGLTREQFHESAVLGASVPIYRELPADLETPVSVYLKLSGSGYGVDSVKMTLNVSSLKANHSPILFLPEA